MKLTFGPVGHNRRASAWLTDLAVIVGALALALPLILPFG